MHQTVDNSQHNIYVVNCHKPLGNHFKTYTYITHSSQAHIFRHSIHVSHVTPARMVTMVAPLLTGAEHTI
jgi:hypothetical protein